MDIQINSEGFEESVSDNAFAHVNLDQDQQNFDKIDETIKNISRNLRKGDWTYLCRHPEIRAIIRVITTEAIKNHPENIFKFTAELFQSKNHKTLTKEINKQLKWVNKQVRGGEWSPAEGVMLFSESSTSSFITKKATCDKLFDDKSSDCDKLQNMCPENFKPSC